MNTFSFSVDSNLNPILLLIMLAFMVSGVHQALLAAYTHYVLRIRRSLNGIFSLLFLGFGLLIITILLYSLGFYREYPRLTLLFLPTLGIIGPVNYAGFIVLLTQSSRVKSWRPLLKHLILPVLLVAGYTYISLLPSEVLVSAIETYKANDRFTGLDLFYIIPFFIHAVYISGAVRDTWKIFTFQNILEEWTVRLLFYFCVAMLANCLAFALFLWFKKTDLLLLTGSILAFRLSLVYILGKRYPMYFLNVQNTLNILSPKYSRSVLSGMDLQVLESNLVQTMERDCLYREEDLTLPTLADDLGVAAHQLSEFLNRVLGKSFSDFVNEYRVQEACEQIQANPQKSLLSVGYDVGFNSKASFNRAFSKHIGMAPSKYRAKISYGEEILLQ